MHLQVRSSLSSSTNGGTGAMASDEVPGGTVATRPGRLVRLLDLLAEDRSDDPADGHGPFNLVMAAGSGIETTGTFVFAVDAGDDAEEDEHRAAVNRIFKEFPDSDIVKRHHAELPHREGALRDYVKGFSDQGYLIDEIVLAVATCGDPETVPVQVRLIDAPTGR